MDNDQAEASADVDVNEALENIFMSEENILEENYRKGFDTGKAQGNTEAYHLGTKFPCLPKTSFHLISFSSLRIPPRI